MSKHDNRILSGNKKVDGVYHTLEWLVTAFAGTLVFIVFVMQVYRIPTGSMAETLRGAHYRIRCPQCGYRYDHDFIARSYGLPDTVSPTQEMVILPRSPICPTCGFRQRNPVRAQDGRFYVYDDTRLVPAETHTVFKGAQIFFIKSVYHFFEPKRWDVFVFKNPLEPQINYIKRCIGLPGETVQLVDGDVYINGQIARKPDKVQEELWMLIYDNDYPPVQPERSLFYAHDNLRQARQRDYLKTSWQQPFIAIDPDWNLQLENGTVFELNSRGYSVQRIRYNDQYGRGYRAFYAYDDPDSYPHMPIASDLMVQYHLTLQDDSSAGAQIRKDGQTYQGTVSSDGTLEIVRFTDGGAGETVQQGTVEASAMKPMTKFRFAAVDRQLVLQYGDKKIVYDLGADLVAVSNERAVPEVHLVGTGGVRLAHIGLYRDIHYTVVDAMGRPIVHGTPDSPMVLKEDQFFACGDNSPASFDSRFWDIPGKGNNSVTYDPGVVPRDYLVGKAFFVHWPGGYRVRQEPIRWIPFVDGMKVIYGGRD